MNLSEFLFMCWINETISHLNSSDVLSEKSSVKNSATLQFSVAPSYIPQALRTIGKRDRGEGIVRYTHQLRFRQLELRRNKWRLLASEAFPVDVFKERMVLSSVDQ